MKDCGGSGEKLTHDNCRVGMKVRTTIDMTSSNKGNKLSAGDCGTVTEHCREGIYTDADNYTCVLKVNWEEIVWDHSEAYMHYLVINEH